MGAGIKMVANNKKAYHDYFIDDKFEAGIELFGTEVKSIRMGKCSIKEAFIKIESDGQVYVFGMHITPYVYRKKNKIPAYRAIISQFPLLQNGNSINLLK